MELNLAKDECYRGDFTLVSKRDDMVYSMKKARYYLMLIAPEKRAGAVNNAIGILGASIAYAETNNNDDYVKRICAPEPEPETPILPRRRAGKKGRS